MADPAKPDFDLEKHRARRNEAQPERERFRQHLDEVYDLMMPWARGVTSGAGTTRTEGEDRIGDNRIFDNTGPMGLTRFAGKLQTDMFPPGQENMGYAAGEPLRITNPRAAARLDKQLAPATKLSNAMLTTGDWDMAFHEMALNLGAGTGCMMMLPGDNKRRFARFASASIVDVALEASGYGDVTGTFYDQKWSWASIARTWKNSTSIPEVRQKVEKEPNAKTLVHQDCVFDPEGDEERPWQQVVHIKDVSQPIVEPQRTRTSIFLTPRYFRMPNQAMGFGPALLALPSVRTLNVAQELTLKAAAIALLGIYTVTDDQFNIDQAVVEPGAFWKVSRNGGYLGKAIERFADPRLDLTNIVLNEIRDQVKMALMDQALPPDTAGAKSAMEIMERVKRLASDHRGAYGRLVREIYYPLGARLLELAYDARLLPGRIDINDVLVAMDIKSPLASSMKLDRVEREAQYLQLLYSLDPSGQLARSFVKIETMAGEWARSFSIDPNLVYAPDEQQQIAQTVQAMVKTAIEGAMAAMAAQQKQVNQLKAISGAANGAGGQPPASEAAAPQAELVPEEPVF